MDRAPVAGCDAEDRAYFEEYGTLDAQMNMVTDHPRTQVYHDAILALSPAFTDAVVVDVGAGTGVLSLFSCRAGARQVIAIEASKAFGIMRTLLRTNAPAYRKRVRGLHRMLENITLADLTTQDDLGLDTAAPPDDNTVAHKADILVSEPMGICLLEEGMLRTFLLARDRFLKPDGLMVPSKGAIYAGVTTSTYYSIYLSRQTELWRYKNLYGIDWRALHHQAQEEVLRRPVIMDVDEVVLDEEFPDGLNARIGAESDEEEDRTEWKQFWRPPIARSFPFVGRLEFDFTTCSADAFESVEIPFQVGPLESNVTLTAFVCWFDVELTPKHVLSTGPLDPDTHWHQTCFVLRKPFLLVAGTAIKCSFKMVRKDRTYSCQGLIYQDDLVVGGTLVCDLLAAVQV